LWVTPRRKRSRRIIYLFETQGDVAEAQRLARRSIVSEDDYQQVAKLIDAAAVTRRNVSPCGITRAAIPAETLWQ
jgi:hypothetical protein